MEAIKKHGWKIKIRGSYTIKFSSQPPVVFVDLQFFFETSQAMDVINPYENRKNAIDFFITTNKTYDKNAKKSVKSVCIS